MSENPAKLASWYLATTSARFLMYGEGAIQLMAKSRQTMPGQPPHLVIQTVPIRPSLDRSGANP